MKTDFEWIAMAMGLMTLCSFVLPAFCWWRDKHADDRLAGRDRA